MDTMTSFFSSSYAYAFTWTMIHSLWQCALVALGLAISLRINRHQSASIRYLQALAAMVICVLLSILTYLHSQANLVAATQTAARFGNNLLLAYNDSFWQLFYVLLNKNIDLILSIWSIGFVLQLGRYGNDFFRAHLLRSRGCSLISAQWQQRFEALAQQVNVKKAIQVKESVRVTSICVIGHLKPVVLLPVGLLTGLSVAEVEALMLHELAHIQRNDYFINAVQCLVKLVYFFNPGLLWISQQMDIERENACDDIAVQHCGSPKLFARSLANISELELRLASVLAAKQNRYRMLPRVKRLFRNSSGVAKSMEQFLTAVFAGLVVVAMNVSAHEFNLPQIQTPTTLEIASPSTPVASEKVGPTNAPMPPVTVAEPAGVAAKPPVAATSALDFVQQSRPPAASTPRVTAPPLKIAEAEVKTAAKPAAATPAPTTPQKVKLEALQTPHFNQFYVATNTALPLTRKVYVEKTEVEFADIWMERFRSQTSERYKTYIRDSYGEAYTNALRDNLRQQGWHIVEAPAPDALSIRPKLMDLYIYAPETSGVKIELVARAGQSGTELLFMTPDGDTFMKIIDYRNTEDTYGGAVEANRATNFLYFDRLMQAWSKQSIHYLDRVMSIVESQNTRKG